MDFDLVFPVSEGTVAGVCRARNAQLWEFLEGKKIRCVASQTAERAAQSAMPKLAKLIPFFQKIDVSVADRLHAGKEVRFRERHNLAHQTFDRAAASRLRMRRQISIFCKLYHPHVIAEGYFRLKAKVYIRPMENQKKTLHFCGVNEDGAYQDRPQGCRAFPCPDSGTSSASVSRH